MYHPFFCVIFMPPSLVLRKLMGVDWDIVEQVQALRCGGSSGDWLDAVMVAMDMLHNHELVELLFFFGLYGLFSTCHRVESQTIERSREHIS